MFVPGRGALVITGMQCLVLENSLDREPVGMDAPGYNPFPTGSRIEIWWPGDKIWYTARVTGTRIELHKVRRRGAKVPCHEVYCVYELDNHEQWHSLHNNKIREKTGVIRPPSHCPL